ncbi:hypothetical protein Ahy_B09g095784 isoform B [Arachis hypogaea]|uniref:NAD(P)-binding domain-containing protein n=1 Tax=Arachis hypogaea TaxID=3818 RepID=A0A444XGS9_ARAHY|nr:hypothetical protein Ahy_B09g095784 isoform B [Arachis hypogaea]
MALVCSSTLSSILSLQSHHLLLDSQTSTTPFRSSFLFINTDNSFSLVCHAKKKLTFFDQILDYIEGGPKLRKWYGAPDLLPKDDTNTQDEEDDYPEDEIRDAVLVTDGDSEMGQMVILSLIVKPTRIKALVKDKRAALEAFGTYVEVGFSFQCWSLQGVQHIILLSQLSVYSGKSGIQSMMKSNAKKLAEQDESVLKSSGIPYTIIRTGAFQDTAGGNQGFTFDQGCAASGSISKEDAAFVCVQALDCVPQSGFIFEVANGQNQVSDWKQCLTALMEKPNQ